VHAGDRKRESRYGSEKGAIATSLSELPKHHHFLIEKTYTTIPFTLTKYVSGLSC
jgi:hypothetical protein